MTAIAIDDEPLALDVIKTFCAKVDFINLERTFIEAGAALKYLQDHPVDLLFLDINMPAISGIDFYKRVDQNIMVIFTTAHSEYAIEGFNLDAIDYVLKPFEFSRFQKALEKAREFHEYTSLKENSSSSYLFVKVDYSLAKVIIKDIFYIEGLDSYIKFHFENGKTLLLRSSLKSIAEKLPAHEFIRVHRSYIIAISKIDTVQEGAIIINGKPVPVADAYRSALNKRMNIL